ncbi:hypothetical protein DDB_G0291574 [Dictyostelium discoideum AX4]|uniref:Niemann-Pick C1 N-terminal domain-containing protein n=1 Tax=Dictyostelium discoideum TaxID=44689 RepID=Q54ED0_DICDI|nr:hypothetical protein DDB_G0291574 [Dictyostelium discoideum AX4]EAL61771.1 hypothetical protein DDB_G0291574 [Dictyostelium discoideum AX4]|eukprot:XP_635310.1 hypothetical protein DDB_G0291574 [Dictyostelium discoideum AX4]
MNLNIILIFFIYFFCFTLLVKSQGPFPYNTTEGCSIFGNNATFVKNSQFPPYNSVSITSGTCQASHPEYSQKACCYTYQTNGLKTFIQSNETLFGQCPGCLANVWSLWCGSICSPFQQSFMVPTETITQTLQVVKIDFILHPDFAQGLYESCSSIKTENGKTFSSLYSDKQSFFNGVFSDNPQYKINFVFNTTGYNSDITPCSGPEKTTTSSTDSTSSAQSKHSIQYIFYALALFSVILIIGF